MTRRNIFLLSVCACAAPLLFALPGSGNIVDPLIAQTPQECETTQASTSHQLEPEGILNETPCQTSIVSTPRTNQAHARSLAPSGGWHLQIIPTVTTHRELRMVHKMDFQVSPEANHVLSYNAGRQQNADRRRGETHDGFT